MTRKVWTVATVIVIVIVMALGARALAQDGSADGERRTITVTSTATVGSEPDQASLRLGITAQADESADALTENERITDAVVAALSDAGVEADDVQTERFDVSRRTVDRRTPQERRVFVVDSTLAVTVRDLGSVGSVIGAAVDAGATNVHDVRFEVSDPAHTRAQALEQAVEGARAKADAMAAAGGVSVTGVERIVEEGAARPVYEESYRAAALVVGDAAASIVPPDELDTSVTIAVTWTIG